MEPDYQDYEIVHICTAGTGHCILPNTFGQPPSNCGSCINHKTGLRPLSGNIYHIGQALDIRVLGI